MISLVLLAAAAAADPPICADRPSKANGTCTVPPGRVQIETGMVDWTHDRSDGVRSDLILWGSTFIKYGLGQRSDIEIGFTPLETLRIHGGVRARDSGFGDTVVRLKQRLTGDEAPAQVAIIPFIKVPTASRFLGNGKVEGGVAVPLTASLSKSITLTLGPELDARADGDGHGYHAAMTQLVNLGFAANSRLSLTAELWRQWDWDPDGTERQASADLSAAYLARNDLQIDAGTNFGLNRHTAGIEVYAGISKRF